MAAFLRESSIQNMTALFTNCLSVQGSKCSAHYFVSLISIG